MLELLSIAGGVCLILFGVRFLRKGLDRLFGTRLGAWVQRLGANRFRAMLTGVGVSLVAPSSTTISLLAVETIRAGHMTMQHTLAFMFGSDIGMTVTVLLIALRLDHYAPILALLGVVMFQFAKSDRVRGIGQVILSLAFVFLGVGVIKASTTQVMLNPDVKDLMHIVSHYPLMIAAAAMLMAFLLQSSTAAIGGAIALGASGALDLPLAVAVVAGANIGVAITTLLVGWRPVEARRLAIANLARKIPVAAAVLIFLPQLVALLQRTPHSFDLNVAFTHTGFNLATALLGMLFMTPLARLAHALVPAPNQPDGPVALRHIVEGPVEETALALGLSLREIMHAAEIVRTMFADVWTALTTGNPQLAHNAARLDDQIEFLDRKISQFLARTVTLDRSEDVADEQMRQLRYLNDLETIADLVHFNLADLALKRARAGLKFSPRDLADMNAFQKKVAENLLIADTAFTTRDRQLAAQLLRHKDWLNEHERQLRDRFLIDLRAADPASFEAATTTIDILTHLKRINSQAAHVGYQILGGRASRPHE